MKRQIVLARSYNEAAWAKVVRVEAAAADTHQNDLQ